MSSDEMAVDEFKLLNCLSQGQHSQVWEAMDSTTTRRVAMKLLLPDALEDKDQIASLKHEAKVGSSMNHPNILKYFNAVVKKKQAYFTMELFPAPNLKTGIFNDLNCVHVRIKRLIELIALALEHIHQAGWLHKDMKPDNILFTKGSDVRLIDFSLASRIPSALSKMFGGKQAIQGTRTYISPEQILGKKLSTRCDLYSFGITIFEMLAGEPPFKGSSPNDLLLRHLSESAPAPSSFNSNVTPEMDRIVARLLMKKPDARYESVGEFLSEFRRVNVFKEAVQEKIPGKEEAVEDDHSLDKRLDSRADAQRQGAGGKSPAAKPAAKPPPPKPAQPVAGGPPPARPAPPPNRPPAAVPMPPVPMPAPPGMPPQYGYPPGPPQFRPGMPPGPMPGYGMPQPGPMQIPPGMPQPQFMPAAQGPYVPQPPGPMRPPQAQPPRAPGPPQGGPPRPGQPAPLPPGPVVRPATPAPRPEAKPSPKVPDKTNDDDLPMFDELPPVL